MKNFYISKSRRVRSTPFTSRIEKQGVKNYTVYNHMLLPTTFSSVDEEYVHLKKDVQVWDVSVQREVEISGIDAHKLVQLMTCRDLSKSKIGSCYYVPLVDSNGGMINDPLIYKLKDDLWRICIADSDVLLFAKGIAAGKKVDLSKIMGRKYFNKKSFPFSKKTNFNSLRIGKVVGEHEVKFSSGKEIITLNHESFDRALYSEGALVAAKWLVNKKPGLYSMRNVLNFK